LDYVETNAAWVKGRDETAETLAGLAACGLSAVLVSVSPFHAEFVPPKKTLLLIELAEEILAGGPFVWLPNFLPDIYAYPRDERLNLSALIAQRGNAFALELASRYGLIPGGRAAFYLARHGVAVPWRDLLGEAPCRIRLSDTDHFHVDGQGLYLPGFCGGLSLPLKALPGVVSLSEYPVISTLLDPDGLGRLIERAKSLGYSPNATYSSPCHLCADVRSFLFEVAPSPDLAPAGYYAELIGGKRGVNT
jgi:hypothetical protein